MNPLEAMAKAIFTAAYLNEDWSTTPNAIRLGCTATARAALDALADNVSEKMILACEQEWSHEEGLRAALRVVGEE